MLFRPEQSKRSAAAQRCRFDPEVRAACGGPTEGWLIPHAVKAAPGGLNDFISRAVFASAGLIGWARALRWASTIESPANNTVANALIFHAK